MKVSYMQIRPSQKLFPENTPAFQERQKKSVLENVSAYLLVCLVCSAIKCAHNEHVFLLSACIVVPAPLPPEVEGGEGGGI